MNSTKDKFRPSFGYFTASIGLALCSFFLLIPFCSSHDGTEIGSFADKEFIRIQSASWHDHQRGKPQRSTSVSTQSTEKLRVAFLTAQNTSCPIEQNQAFENCLNGLSPQDAANVLASMSLEELNGVASERLFYLWSNTSPQEALKWALGLDHCNAKNVFINMAARRWASQDLQGAEHWVRNFPEGESRMELMNAIIKGAMTQSPTDALRIASEFSPEGSTSHTLIVEASGEWVVLDRNNAVAWAREIVDENLRQEVMETMAILTIDQDVRAAIDIALNDMAAGEQQDRVLASAVQSWAQQEPAVAASWVRHFPDDHLGEVAAEMLINYWVDSDPKASGEWLASLAPSKLRNKGVIAYARALRRTDTAMADRWEAELLSDL